MLKLKHEDGARTGFRVLAGIISIIAACAIVIWTWMMIDGYDSLGLTLLMAVIICIDAGAIAIRGNGLLLFKSRSKHKKKLSKIDQ